MNALRILLLLALSSTLVFSACGSDDDDRDTADEAESVGETLELGGTDEGGDTDSAAATPGECEREDPLNAECNFGNRGDVCWIECYCNEPTEGRLIWGAGRCSNDRCAGATTMCNQACGSDNWEPGNFCSDVTAN